MELKGFRCGTEGFSVLNRGVFAVELRGFFRGTEGFYTILDITLNFKEELRTLFASGFPQDVKERELYILFHACPGNNFFYYQNL